MDTVIIDEKIKALRSEKIGALKISQKLKLPRRFVVNRIIELGLPYNCAESNFRVGTGSPLRTKENELISNLVAEGVSTKEISQRIGISTVAVNKRIAKLGIKRPKKLLCKERDVLWDNFLNNPDTTNRNKLVEANLKLVYYVAHKFSKTLDFEDLVQTGTLGLIKAIERFDPTKGNQFSSYAVVWIKGEIMHHLRDCHNLIKCRGGIIPVLYLDVKISAEHENGMMFLDTIPTKEICKWEGMDLQAAIETLEPQYREVLELHFFQGIEQRIIAQQIGVTPKTVNCRIKSALFYLKHELN